MAGSSAWLSVIVKRGQQIVKDRTIFQCAWEDTFGSLLLKFGSELEAETINQVVISKNEKYLDPCHKVPIDAPVSLCDQFGCLFVCLYLSEMQTTGVVPTRTIASVLMESSRELVLPDPATPAEGKPLRADQKLRNDVLGTFREMNVGWPRDNVASVGESLTQKLTRALWYIDVHHEKFAARSILLPSRIGALQGYNDYKRKKEKAPRLSAVQLNNHVQELSGVLMQPWFSSKRFEILRQEVEVLVNAMKTYCEYLENKDSEMKERHQSLEPSQSDDN